MQGLGNLRNSGNPKTDCAQRTATAAGGEMFALCRAEHVINSETEDIAKRVKEITGEFGCQPIHIHTCIPKHSSHL